MVSAFQYERFVKKGEVLRKLNLNLKKPCLIIIVKLSVLSKNTFKYVAYLKTTGAYYLSSLGVLCEFVTRQIAKCI